MSGTPSRTERRQARQLAAVAVALALSAAVGCREGGETSRTAAASSQEAVAQRLSPRPPDAAPPEAPATPAATVPEADREAALALFAEAHDAVLVDRELETGIERLELAVAKDPEFGEAWFQLGSVRLELACERLGEDDESARSIYRGSLQAMLRARALTARGALRVWDAFELRDAEQEIDAALTGIDERTLDDPDALRAALERAARARGYLEAPASPDQEPDRP